MCEPTPTPTPTSTPPPVTIEGCCIESQGVCDLTEASGCSVPPNIEFMGIGTICSDQPMCEMPPTSVPTMNEWGLIATAVMLGLFGLFTVRRGFKINNKES